MNNEIFEKIRNWARDRALNDGDARGQFLKVAEELGEVAAAMARGEHNDLVDSLGDITVTLIILAQQHGLRLEDCLESAYKVIRNRDGKLINGVFVKSEDLKNEDKTV